MTLLFVYLITSTISLLICNAINNIHITRKLLQETSSSPTSTEYTMDCCERTSGLMYDTIDCYDDNTPIIVNEIQNYLLDPTNDCTNKTNCAYSTASTPNMPSTTGAIPETNKCLIAWALLQQYYNNCPQIVMTTTNTKKTISDLPEAAPISNDDNDNNNNNGNDIDTTEAIDYEQAPKRINPLIYKMYINEQDCMKCYGKYMDDDGMGCHGYCDLGGSDECGVCSMVHCLGDINNAEDIDTGLYGMGALQIWERALLLASVVILGCICCWGVCYLCCNGSNSLMNRTFGNNNNQNMNMLQVVNNEESD